MRQGELGRKTRILLLQKKHKPRIIEQNSSCHVFIHCQMSCALMTTYHMKIITILEKTLGKQAGYIADSASKHEWITQNELHISPEGPPPSTPTPQLLPVWRVFFFFSWRGGRIWISITWSPPASRHMTPGTAEDKAHLKDTEKEMEGLGRGDCGANVRFHRHRGMLSVGTGMQRTRFPLRTQNSLSSPQFLHLHIQDETHSLLLSVSPPGELHTSTSTVYCSKPIWSAIYYHTV